MFLEMFLFHLFAVLFTLPIVVKAVKWDNEKEAYTWSSGLIFFLYMAHIFIPVLGIFFALGAFIVYKDLFLESFYTHTIERISKYRTEKEHIKTKKMYPMLEVIESADALFKLLENDPFYQTARKREIQNFHNITEMDYYQIRKEFSDCLNYARTKYPIKEFQTLLKEFEYPFANILAVYREGFGVKRSIADEILLASMGTVKSFNSAVLSFKENEKNSKSHEEELIRVRLVSEVKTGPGSNLNNKTKFQKS